MGPREGRKRAAGDAAWTRSSHGKTGNSAKKGEWQAWACGKALPARMKKSQSKRDAKNQTGQWGGPTWK